MPADGNDLRGLRDRINALDDALLELLNQRARLAEEVAELKRGSERAFYVPEREREVVDRLQGANAGPFPSDAIRPVFQEIISACLRLESGLRVAYLGPEATFTHQAVKRHFGTSALAQPCGSIASVFAEVERGQAEFGVVPVENSSEGIVHHTLDSFVDSRLTIAAEIVVDVDHCLLARPGTGETAIRRVYSHPQALGQCRGWLQQNLPRATLVESPSTADAARAAQGDAEGAAIAAGLAARMYGLAVLREKLQDVAENVTRFLVIGDAPPPPPTGQGDKTSVLLVLPDSAGALYQVLRPLADASINLTKIESRPSRRKAWDYIFFLDLDGHAEEPRVAAVLRELEGTCQLFKVLGSYRAADPT